MLVTDSPSQTDADTAKLSVDEHEDNHALEGDAEELRHLLLLPQDEELHTYYWDAEEVQTLLEQNQPQDSTSTGIGSHPKMVLGFLSDISLLTYKFGQNSRFLWKKWFHSSI